MRQDYQGELAALVACALSAVTLLTVGVQGDSRSHAPPPEAIPCRVLEAHTSPQSGVTVIVFHQRDASDRARLGELLRGHSGEAVEIQTADGHWHAATVLRLKSCFGRGLLLFPAKEATLGEKDEFVLRFSSKAR